MLTLKSAFHGRHPQTLSGTGLDTRTNGIHGNSSPPPHQWGWAGWPVNLGDLPATAFPALRTAVPGVMLADPLYMLGSKVKSSCSCGSALPTKLSSSSESSWWCLKWNLFHSTYPSICLYYYVKVTCNHSSSPHYSNHENTCLKTRW